MNISKYIPAMVIPVFFLVLAFVILRPYLLAPGFSLVDDGYSLLKGKQILESRTLQDFRSSLVENDIGRVRPTYLLYFSIFYLLFGTDPIGLWFGQFIVLWLLLWSIYKLIKHLTQNHSLALLAPFVWLIMPTIWANQVRLGTAEPRQLLWINLAMLAFFNQEYSAHKKIIFTTLWTVLAIGTKETSILLLPFFGLLIIFQQPSKKRAMLLPSLAIATIVLLISLFMAVRLFLPDGYAVHNFGAPIQEFIARAAQSRSSYARYYYPILLGLISLLARLTIGTWFKEQAISKKNSISFGLLLLIAESLCFVLLWRYQFDRYFYLTWFFTVMLLFVEVSNWQAVLRKYAKKQLFNSDLVFVLTALVVVVGATGYYHLLNETSFSPKAIALENLTNYKSSFDAVQLTDKVIQPLLLEPNITHLYTTSDNYEVIYELGLYASRIETRPVVTTGVNQELAEAHDAITYSNTVVQDFLVNQNNSVLVGTVAELSTIKDVLIAHGLEPEILIPNQLYGTFNEQQFWWIVRPKDTL